MGNVGICTIAKNENTYIDEWVRYHIHLGFDHIWLYDNNDTEAPFVGDCISENYKEYVTIIDKRGKNFGDIPNTFAYNDFLENYASQVEWCAFIDIDEFVHCEFGFDLRGWILSIPSEVNFIKLYWNIYGDNDIIEGDETKSVIERFTKQSDTTRFRGMYKTIMRCTDITDIFCGNAHCFHIKNNDIGVGLLPPYYNCNLKTESDWDRIKDLPICLNHYMTKSLSEFIKYKENRISGSYGIEDKIDYYFMINERTAEKEQYIEEHINGTDS